MPYRFGCFISYAHDSGDLVQAFITDLQRALESELGAYLDSEQKLWFDKERLSGGLAHRPEIARAMCESACWIMVYSPKYRRKEFCRREYRAMRELEAARKQALGSRFPREHAMIIPMIIRGDLRDLPRGVPDSEFVVDFSDLGAVKPHFYEQPQFRDAIARVAERIWAIWKVCEHSQNEPADCDTFGLPDPDDDDWGPEVGGPAQARPL